MAIIRGRFWRIPIVNGEANIKEKKGHNHARFHAQVASMQQLECRIGDATLELGTPSGTPRLDTTVLR